MIPDSKDPPVDPLDPSIAKQLCSIVTDRVRNENCVADVMVTGEAGFADIHHISELIATGSTRTLLDDAANPTAPQAEVTFTATVSRNASDGSGVIPAGTVQLSIDGKDAGTPVKLDGKGQAVWTTALGTGDHRVVASYTAEQGSAFLPSTSTTLIHTVR